MADYIVGFLKRTYKVLIVIFTAVIFFLGYNTYLLDRSLANLKFALDRVDTVKNMEEARKLAKILDYSLLAEVASKELVAIDVAKLELAKEILSRPQDMTKVEKDARKIATALRYSLLSEVAEEELQETSIPMVEMAKDILLQPQSYIQFRDVKFALDEVIRDKEKRRPAALRFLDKISELIFPIVTEFPKEKLEKQARELQKRIETLKDTKEIQDAYYELGNIYTQLSEFTQARGAFRKIIELSPSSDLAKKSQFNIAWNQKFIGNLDEAIKEFEILTQQAPTEELGYFSLYQIGDALKKKGDYEAAVAYFQKVADLYHETGLAQLAMFRQAGIYLYDSKDYKKAMGVLERIGRLFGGTTLASFAKDSIMGAALEQYRKEGFMLLVEGYQKQLPEKCVKAIEKFDQVLEIDNKDGLSYVGKALANIWLNQPEKALEYAQKAVQIYPNSEVASVNLGFIYLQTNLLDEAISEFKRFISVNPFTSSRAYYNLGYAYVVSEDIEKATRAFQQATLVDPEFSFAYNNLGWCYWQLNEFAPAIEAFERAIKINSKFAEARYNLGAVYKVVGRYREAQEVLKAITETSPAYSKAQSLLREIEQLTQATK